LHLEEYPYYDYEAHQIDFDAMLETLSTVNHGDVVLLHGCCHNPSGADLTQSQWQTLVSLFNERGAIPFIDVAYQGLGNGLAKNFGLYRERVGAVIAVCETPEVAGISRAQLLSVARGIYSMPPNHGAALVDIILNDSVLYQQWDQELTLMRERITQLRANFVSCLQQAGAGSRFDYIQNEKGMFSFLGVNPEQVKQLKQDHSIYMVNSSRINVAGLSDSNMDYVVQALMKVVDAP